MQERLVLLFAGCLSLSSGLPQRIQAYHATDPPVPVWPTVGVDMQRTGRSAHGSFPDPWRSQTYYPIFGSAAIGTDGTVYIGSTDTFVYALNGTTGKPRWRFAAAGDIKSSPAIGPEGTVYIGSFDTNVYALNGYTGDVVWKRGTDGEVSGSPTLASNSDTLYVGDDANSMHSINSTTGAWIWNFSTNGPIRCSPALSADGATLFFGSWDSIFYALSASTGALLWSFTTGGRCNGSPALGLDGATVYFGSWDYNLYALSTSTGSLQWAFSAQYAINDSPTVADNMIFFGSMDFFMYALDAPSGKMVWRSTVDQYIVGSPAVFQGQVFVGSETATYAFNATTGATLWSYPQDASLVGSVIVASDGGLVFGTRDNNVYALSVAPAGYYLGPFANLPTFLPCGFGNYCPGGFRLPIPCPAGSWASSITASSCLPCPEGTYGPSSGLASCIPCTAGFYNPSAGASSPASCLPCPSGESSPDGAGVCYSPPTSSRMSRAQLLEIVVPVIAVFLALAAVAAILAWIIWARKVNMNRLRKPPFASLLSKQLGLEFDDFDTGVGLDFAYMCEAIAEDIESTENGTKIARLRPGSASLRSLAELTATALLQLPEVSAGFIRPLKRSLCCSRHSGGQLTPEAIQAGTFASARIAQAVTRSVKWEAIAASLRIEAVSVTRRLALQRLHDQPSAADDLLPEPRLVSAVGIEAVRGPTLQRYEPSTISDDLNAMVTVETGGSDGALTGIALTTIHATPSIPSARATLPIPTVLGLPNWITNSDPRGAAGFESEDAISWRTPGIRAPAVSILSARSTSMSEAS